jgi:hypothetical protein
MALADTGATIRSASHPKAAELIFPRVTPHHERTAGASAYASVEDFFFDNRGRADAGAKTYTPIIEANLQLPRAVRAGR